MELLPYHWEWKGVSELYVNITRSMGGVHHYAWRAQHPKWVKYKGADDLRYKDWTAEECTSRFVEGLQRGFVLPV